MTHSGTKLPPPQVDAWGQRALAPQLPPPHTGEDAGHLLTDVGKSGRRTPLPQTKSVLNDRPAFGERSRAGVGRRLIHVPTLIAISLTAWALTIVLHEIVGHAGSALLLGIPVKAVSTTTAFIDSAQVQSATEYRLINAAGVLVNLVTGAAALLILRFRRSASRSWRCFLWLFATMSLVIAVMNLVTAALLGGGDWAEITETLEPRALYVALVVGAGILVAIAGYRISLRAWMPDLADHDRTAQLQLTLIPVVVLTIFQSLSLVASPFATAPPESNHLIASVFAYVHFGLWALLVNLVRAPRSSEPAESIRLQPSRPWLMVGLAVFLLFVLVLGPGLGPLADDPRLN